MTKSISLNDFTKSMELCIEKFFDIHTKETSGNLFYKKIMEIIKKNNFSIDYKHHYPIFVDWKITSDCNLRCEHCYFHEDESNFDSSKDLSAEKIFELADEIVDMDIFNINLTGGEIFLRKDIFDIIYKLKLSNVALKLTTNATLITKEIAANLKTLLNPITDSIQVSIDGATEETHDLTRGKGSFQKTIRGINFLREEGLPILVNSVITANNVNEIGDLYKLSQSLGVKRISFTKLVPCHEGQEKLTPHFEELVISMTKAIILEKQNTDTSIDMLTFKPYDFLQNNIARTILKKILAPENLKITLNKNCQCHNNHKVYIDSSGEVSLCNFISNMKTFSIGNVKHSSLKNIWNDKDNNIFFKERNSNKMICQKCKYICWCKGGCPAKAYEKYGSILAPDKNCMYGEYLTKMQPTNL